VKSRVLTAIGLIPFVLGAFFCANPIPILLLAGIASLLSLSELARLINTPTVWLGLLWPLLFRMMGPELGGPLMLVPTFLVGVFATWQASQDKESAPFIAPFASLWPIVPIIGLVMMHGIAPVHTVWKLTSPLLLAVIPLWGGDTAAIFAGKAFGKTPLAPKISPKKTVEGGIANLLACLVVATLVANAIGQSVLVGLLCGTVAGILGQIGDLFESGLKRAVGVKDSGTLLPGHGGILDRIDSILFTAPFVWLITSLLK